MNISEFFIRRATTTTLVMAALAAFGIIGYRSLPVSDLPNVDFPTISVSASLPGASPETMAASVATPLERQFATIAGVDSVNSSSTLGNTSITIQFNLSRNIDGAAQDVQAAISKASRQLPANMPAPPSYQKVNPADAPILFVALASPTLPLSEVDEYAETLMAQRISTVDGVAQVQVYGSQKYAVRIQLDPNKLASRGISIDEVRTALAQNNVNLPNGTLYGKTKAYTVQATGQLTNAAAYRPLIVAYRNNNPVRLQELGTVQDSVENNKTANWLKDTRSVMLAIQRQPGTNTVEIVDSIKKLLPTFRGQIPASVSITILFDRSQAIRDSIKDVKITLLLTIVLVVLVIFFFLRNPWATIIPSLAVPLSLIGTFAVMDILGYTLDNLSLMALTLSVGFVVDDAVVMLENIVRHQELGQDRMEAALDGSREIGFTIVSMTISLIAVFIPVLFMAGIVGRLLREFAVVITVAIVISGFISLTLTPMLASRFLKHVKDEKHGRLYNWSEAFFVGMQSFYEKTLRRVLDFRLTTVIVSIALTLVTGYLFYKIPKGFLPNDDNGLLTGTTEGLQDIAFDDLVRHQQEAERIVSKDPAVETLSSSVGGGFGSGNQGRLVIRLKDRGDRPAAQDVVNRLRRQLSRIPGLNAYVSVPPTIRLGGQGTKSPYQFTLQDTDTKILYQYAPKMEAKLKTLHNLQDVTTDLQIASPQVNLEIDRDKANALGVTPEAIENTLYDAYGQRQVTQIYTPSNEYYVVMELEPQYQLDPNALSRLYVRSSNNQLVPLETVTHMGQGVAPLTVTHYGQLPAVTISFDLRPGAALGDAVNSINEAAKEVGLPATTTTTFQGTAQAFQTSLKGLGVLLFVAIMVIYLVLGILYESFIHPITILSGLPSAGLGALLTLMLFGSELNLYGFVGLILLIGIVKKNAIMMIDFAVEAQRDHGKNAHDAIFEGSLLRFRPIMMTTMAALLGTLPIALGIGAGAESRRSLGLAVVGGLLVSQVLTLYLTPVVYTYLEEFQEWIDRKRNKPEKPSNEEPHEPKNQGPNKEEQKLSEPKPQREREPQLVS